MMDCLAIFAAGKSLRFGGIPKAFCDLGGRRNIENTIILSKRHFKKIYLVVNMETFASGVAKGLDADVISIVTGQGDADSIRKALERIASKTMPQVMAACWGDAVFLSDEPFIELEAGLSEWSTGSPVLVGCSMDENPYAWFDAEGKTVTRAHFRKRERKPCDYGLHDQSIFAFHPDILLEYLTLRRRNLGLDRFDEDTYDAARGEMGLLDAFTWFYEEPEMSAAEYCELTPGRVLGFNTPEELALAAKRMKEFRYRGNTGAC